MESRKQTDLSRFFNIPKTSQSTATEQNTNEPEQTTEEPHDGEPLKKKQKQRTFQNDWLIKYNWLRFDKDTSSMTCDICIRAGGENTFTGTGCTNFQNGTCVRHQESKSHVDCAKILQLRSNFDSAKKNADQKQPDSGVDPQIDGHIKQLRTVYVVAKRDIAADVFTSLMDLQLANGVKLNKDDYYKRPQILTEFEQSIQDVIESNLKEKLQASDYIGIMLDETCDISVEKKLALNYMPDILTVEK